MSKLSQLMDKISGRKSSGAHSDRHGSVNADSPEAGGEPYPNAPTVEDNKPGE